MKINRLIDAATFDVERFYHHITIFQESGREISKRDLSYSPDGFNAWWYADQLQRLVVNSEHEVVIPDDFVEKVLENMDDFEEAILNEMFYKYSYDQDEFYGFSSSKKIQVLMDGLDPIDYQCFINYQKDKNIIKLVEEYYGMKQEKKDRITALLKYTRGPDYKPDFFVVKKRVVYDD